MQATDWIKKKVKSFTTVRTITNVPLSAITGFSRVPMVPNKNTSFLHLSNTL